MNQRIQKLLSKFLPTKSRFVRNINQHEPVMAHLLDVDRLHGALRSAEAGDTSALFGLYRDMIGAHTHVQGEFSKRKLAVLGETFTLTPKDADDETQVEHAEAVKAHLESIPDLIRTLAHILDSTLYPVSLTERLYRASQRPGWRFEIKDLIPVEHHMLTWPEGVFSIRKTDEQGNFTGVDDEVDPTCYIIHRGHLLTSLPDWHGGPMRALMFWWFFSVASRDWWGRFLERFGSPFIVGSYDSDDDSARFELQDAFQAAQRLFAVVVSNDVQVEMHQANAQGGGDAFEKFHAVANREISKLIVGQTLSAEGQNLGLGGGQASAQSAVRDDVRQFDAKMLAHTIKTQILAPLWTLNGWTTPIPNVGFGGESTEDQTVTSEILKALPVAGLRITDEGIETITKKFGIGIERDAGAAPLSFTALSADDEPNPVTLIPSVARRAERKRQARRATEAMLSAASPQLAKIMKDDFDKFIDAIETSTSPEQAQERIATLTASYDPTEASMLIENALTSASVNALVTTEV